MVHVRLLLICLLAAGAAYSQDVDTDRDGLPDNFEQVLLTRFAPSFYMSQSDCDGSPAEFVEGSPEPSVKARNGAIYGQVFPVQPGGVTGKRIEIHFYHLWGSDCGLNGHPLDTESVAALLRVDRDPDYGNPAAWHADFWYATAHEDTLCDMSNAAAASSLHAVSHGPDVWVSRDKHASFLSKDLCVGGCGRGQCDGAEPLRISKLINLGEPGVPMNGAAWAASTSWPLASKMKERYTPSLVARMPENQEVAIVPARDVVRGTRTTIKVAGKTYESLASADASTETAIAKGAHGAALGVGAASSAVRKSAKRTFRSIGRFLDPD